MKRRTILGKNPNALKTGQSPYTRYGKRPYLYSPGYREWYRSVTNREASKGEQRTNG